ncbi:MAG: MerR family DNA-binding protein [Ilumatobacteraceae bacterium]
MTPRAVRHYESKGVVPAPARTESGYRLFTDEDIAVLAFIRQGRSLGLSLDAMAEIIEISERGAPCDRTDALLAQRVSEIDAAVADLQRCETRSPPPDEPRSINQPDLAAPSSSKPPSQIDPPSPKCAACRCRRTRWRSSARATRRWFVTSSVPDTSSTIRRRHLRCRVPFAFGQPSPARPPPSRWPTPTCVW